MRILFVRHATAEDKAPARLDDLARKLTSEGRAKARKAFKGLARMYPPPDLVVCSRAARARQTADLLAAAFDADIEVRELDALNPGCGYPEFRKLMRDIGFKLETLAVVGHEPDFSRIIAGIVADGNLRIDVKKASCVEVDMNTLCKGELKAVIPPRIAAGSGE